MDRSFLLQTKFLVPRAGAELIPRPALREQLEGALGKRLILLSAPPGYGKTTLLAELAANSSWPFAWYQLDAADGDPTIFLSYLIACLRHIQEKEDVHQDALPLGSAALSLLEDPEGAARLEAGRQVASSGDLTRVLLVLINDLAAVLEEDWLLFIEDYHLITNPDVHTLVQTLLDKGPPGLHLVISSRSDPPLSLARLRARGQLAEFRAADLRFRQGEVSDWLAQVIPGVDPQSAQLLNEKTEGWAAALQIVLSSLEGKDAGAAGRFISRLNGTQRFIFEYLIEEVFQQQPADRQRFLSHTAVLEQMNAPACKALLGTAHTQAELEKLEQDNLFIVSLDEQQGWYRYHHLFRDFLLGRLRRVDPARLADLEDLAANYYQEQGAYEAAFTHFVRAQNHEAAAGVLTRFAPEYVERGRVAVLQRFLGELPSGTVSQFPELLLQHGNVLWRLGRAGAATDRYEAAQRSFTAQEDEEGVGRVLTQMAELARSQGYYRQAQAFAAEALAHIPREAHASRANALMALAKSEGFLTGMDRGRELAEASVDEARQAGEEISERVRANLLRSLGQICWWHGDPDATLRYSQEALAVVRDPRSPNAANIYITMATPYGYRRDLEMAQRYAELGLDIARQLRLAALLPRAYSSLGSILTRRDQLAQGESCLRQALEASQGLGLESYARVMATGYLAQNLCRQGRIDEARQLAEAVLWERAALLDTYEMVVCRSVLADIALDSNRLDEARESFTNLQEVAERRQYRIPLAMIYFGLAYVHLRQKRSVEGLDYARRSVAILEPLGTWQLFLDQGQRAKTVCQALLQAGQATPFVYQVLQRLPGPGSLVVTSSPEAIIRVSCLGQFRVIAGEEVITQERWVSTKARDLLAYFITHRREQIPLERIEEALWPEGGRQKRAFHSALYRLRQALRGEGEKARFILVEGGEYWLDRERFAIDVDAFEAALHEAKRTSDREAARLYEEATSLYQGDYLSNLMYYDWAAPERRRLREDYVAALRALAIHFAGNREYFKAINHIQKALRFDPLSEDSYCLGMTYYAAIGDKAGLVQQYRQLQAIFAEELAVQPSPPTQQLYQRLLAQIDTAAF